MTDYAERRELVVYAAGFEVLVRRRDGTGMSAKEAWAALNAAAKIANANREVVDD